MDYKNPDFSLKKQFRMQQSIKKVMLTFLRDVKGPKTIDFLEKGSTINRTLA